MNVAISQFLTFTYISDSLTHSNDPRNANY